MEGMNQLYGLRSPPPAPPEFISPSDSSFTQLFNSLHLIHKQISSCVDLKCPAIDIQHFSHILHSRGRARQQQLKSML